MAAFAADFDPQPDPPKPSHWWSGEGHVRDEIGVEHGTIVGDLKYVPGIVGQAFEFNGKDSSIVFGVEAGNFGKGDFSIEFLVRSGTPGVPFLAKRSRCGHENFWELMDRQYSLDESAAAANFAQLRIPETLCDRIWHHVVAVRSGARFAIYRDGELLGAVTNRFVTSLANPHPLVAGLDPCKARFTGQLDEIKLFDQALTEAQIASAAKVVDVLQIRAQPKGGIFKVAPGSHTLVVDAYSPSDLPLRYQWYRNGTPISEATRSGYTVSPVDATTVGSYSVRVTDGVTTLTSDPAVVWVGPTLLAPKLPKLQLPGNTRPTRFQWVIEPEPGQNFTATDLAGVDLETSDDLKVWTIIPGAVTLVDGRVTIVDAEAFARRSAYYRVVYRDPAQNRQVGGAVALARIPAAIVAAAREHLTTFLGPVENRDPEDVAWADVVLGGTARYVHDPAQRDPNQPAFAEIKVVDRLSGSGRGYILVSLTTNHPTIVEFSMLGATKTERALAGIPGQKPQKFVRFGPAFIAMEDGAGNLLGTLGTMPGLPGGTLSPEPIRLEGAYDTEAGGQILPFVSRAHKPFLPFDSYASLRSAFADNPTRTTLRQRRTMSLVSRLGQWTATRNRIVLRVGESQIVGMGTSFERVVVDTDEIVPCVRVSVETRGGFRMEGIGVGTELVKAWTKSGVPVVYTVVIKGSASLASAELQGNCNTSPAFSWTAGEGWAADQRQYHQMKGANWCPVVGCGPTALAMLFGWWDAHGVPSAFYHVRNGIGDAIDFRFDKTSLATADAPQTIPAGHTIFIANLPSYEPSPEEVVCRPVLGDLFELCNTFCVAGQGATTPDDLFDGATEYIDRAVRNLGTPQNEYGQGFMGAQLRVKYTDGYWAGMTDWEGGGVMVANDIKAGRPGIVGLGDTLFDLHYALAYAYRRVDFYQGCGADRELIDRHRWFKCNMGWGPDHAPEWHDAESVWFGMTANLWQKRLPK